MTRCQPSRQRPDGPSPYAARALVIGASGGIGGALLQELERRGETVVGLSRGSNGLDITDEQSIAKTLGQFEGPFDKIIIATGALASSAAGPEKTITALDPVDMAAQFAVNAIGPALILKHALPLLPRNRRSVFAALSARVGSIGDNRLGGWYTYRASKAALNQLIHTAAIELARSRKDAICVAMHPGTVATALSRNYRHLPAVSADEAAVNLLAVIDSLTVNQSGGFFDWSGQEIVW